MRGGNSKGRWNGFRSSQGQRWGAELSTTFFFNALLRRLPIRVDNGWLDENQQLSSFVRLRVKFEQVPQVGDSAQVRNAVVGFIQVVLD